MKPIPFSIPTVLSGEEVYLQDCISRREFSAGGWYNRQCETILKNILRCERALLTSSCTHALEMCAILLDISEGDEIIMASYNFVSAANAFVLRGAKIVFVDIKEETLNIDEDLIEDSITENTKAILVMHYGGVSCNMAKIVAIARKYSLKVIEDAAHCIGAYNNDRHLGSIGDLGTLSFHATKNAQCGEGGALIINNPEFVDRAEIIREKGTNRKAFINGKVDKYTWIDIGSSYLLSELSASFLFFQLQNYNRINSKRKEFANNYKRAFSDYDFYSCQDTGNGHLYYLILDSKERRDELANYLKEREISAYFHYQPLHLSRFFNSLSRDNLQLPITEKMASRILRLPIYYELSKEDQKRIIDNVKEFFDEKVT